MVFDSTDVKNTNNSLYELKEPADGVTRWFVVRDIGAALGETGGWHRRSPLRTSSSATRSSRA
jgi:hypothetical protein